MLLVITDHVSSCALKWSVFTFDFHPPPTLAQGVLFTETYDTIWPGVLKLFKIFDRLPKYEILNEILFDFQLTSGCLFNGPLENPKERS